MAILSPSITWVSLLFLKRTSSDLDWNWNSLQFTISREEDGRGGCRAACCGSWTMDLAKEDLFSWTVTVLGTCRPASPQCLCLIGFISSAFVTSPSAFCGRSLITCSFNKGSPKQFLKQDITQQLIFHPPSPIPWFHSALNFDPAQFCLPPS